MMIYASAIVSAAGVLLAELWFLAFESARIGSGHLSDRTGRIPVIHHRPAIFVAGLLVFWLEGGLRYIAERQRSWKVDRSGPPSSTNATYRPLSGKTKGIYFRFARNTSGGAKCPIGQRR